MYLPHYAVVTELTPRKQKIISTLVHSKCSINVSCYHYRKKKKKTCVSYKDSIKICRGDRNLETKVRLVKAMVFPVVMYGCESWTL